MMHLIRWAALAAAALLCTGPAIAAEKRYGLTSFETIEVDADVTVEVTARAPVSAVASGSPDALDRLLVEARDGKLVIKMRRFAGDGGTGAGAGPVVVRVNDAHPGSALLAGAGAPGTDTPRGELGRG